MKDGFMLYFVILHVKNVLGKPLTVADPSVPVILPLTLGLDRFWKSCDAYCCEEVRKYYSVAVSIIAKNSYRKVYVMLL